MKTRYLLTLATLLVSQRLPAQRASNDECPAPTNSLTRQVKQTLQKERLAWFRRKTGLTDVKPGHLRVLVDHKQRSECQRLNTFYAKSMYSRAPWQRSYFVVDSFYFASFVDSTDPRTGHPRISHIAMFDSNLRILATLSPR